MGFYDACHPFFSFSIHRSRAVQMQTNKTIFPDTIYAFLAKMNVYFI
jgi:hypothetical protein